MRIGLLDLDSHNFPNLALMKLSAFHKSKGDTVDFTTPIEPCDMVYVSKVFTDSPGLTLPPNALESIYGGTGYDLTNKLSDAIEHTCPDYDLYGIKNTAYGFITRGCPRNCEFCIVTQKEGCISRQVADLGEFWRGQKEIKLLDPNLLACKDREKLLMQLIGSGAWVDFTQGLDVRLIDDDCIDLINKIKVKMIHFAWDTDLQSGFICSQLKRFGEKSKLGYRETKVYVLTNFNTTHEFDLYRVYKLRELGFDPYIMIYDKHKFINERTKKMKPLRELLKTFTMEQVWRFEKAWRVQRWVNNRRTWHAVERFEDYNYKIG